MSRNIGGTCCEYCGGTVVLCGPRHEITAAEAGVYLDEYQGMVVADAVCRECLAKYLAWVDGTKRERYRGSPDPKDFRPGQEFGDLSYRSTFNDEPHREDLPQYQVVRHTVFERVGTYNADHDPYGR